MSETMIFSAEELRRLRDSILDGGICEGRKRERDDMAARLSEIRKVAERQGGRFVLPVMIPFTPDARESRYDPFLTAEFNVMQLRALETLFCGRSEV